MRALLDRLDAELLALQAVLHALENERAALEGRDPDALTRASERKAAAVAEAAALKSARDSAPAHDELLHDPAGATAGLRHRLAALRTLAELCQQHNDANGRLILGQKRRVEATLNLLRGGSAAPDAYDRSGTPSYGGRRALRSAC